MNAHRNTESDDSNPYIPPSLLMGLYEVQQEERQVDHVKNLRFFLSCWYAYERYTRANKTTPHHEEEEDETLLRGFEIEMLNFYSLLTNNVLEPKVFELPRESLGDYLEDYGMQKWVENCFAERKTDPFRAFWADLVMVVPGIWIGSKESLQEVEVLAQKNIKHFVYCTRIDEENGDHQKDLDRLIHRNLPLPSHTLTSKDKEDIRQLNGSFHTITLFDLVKDIHWNRHTAKQLKSKYPAGSEFEATSHFLYEILYGEHAHEDETEKSIEEMTGILLYCDSGLSLSISICAAFLMYRFYLPFEEAMILIKTSRRQVSPSVYLERQLKAWQTTLESRRKDKTISFSFGKPVV